MHVVIATDGQMDVIHAADLATRLAGDGGTVTILSIVEIPRGLLNDLRSQFESGDEAVSIDRETVDVRRTQTDPGSWPGADAFIDRYLRDKASERTSALADALRSHGTTAEIDVREGERVARDILDAVVELDADVVCVGSHGAGRFEGLLGSTGTKIARHAPCPVLLIRGTGT